MLSNKLLSLWFKALKINFMINWEQRTIKGKSGKIYKIEPEKITVGRWAEYEIQSLMLAFGSDFKTFYTTLIDILKKIKEIKTLGDVINIAKVIENLIAGIANFAETPEPKIIKFCAIFCNEEGEDTSNYDEIMVRQKFEDWKNIPIADFFLLASEQIPSFRDVYRVQRKETKENLS
jgi:hypothetical protein